MMYHDNPRGRNDFAYLPPSDDYFDYTIKNARHIDYTDIPFVAPIYRTFGLFGDIDPERMIEIVQSVQLQFFDHYLKGRPAPRDFAAEFPEIEVKVHAELAAPLPRP